MRVLLKSSNTHRYIEMRQSNLHYLLLGFFLFSSIIATPTFAESYKKVPTIRENTYKLLSISQRAFENKDAKK